MDKLTQILIEENRTQRTALEAIRGGHAAGIQFLIERGLAPTDSLIPNSVIEAVQLAEKVAEVALGPPGEPELTNTLLRWVVLTYGAHLKDCPGPIGELDCECSWDSVRAKLLEDVQPLTNGVESE